MTRPLANDDARARARRIALAYHREELDMSAAELDAAFGIAPPARDEDALGVRFPAESMAELATPYAVCRGLFQALALGDGDVFLDLGCGLGRVLVYGALVTPARFRGVEIVPERAEQARGSAARLGLERITVACESAAVVDIADVTVFYAHRPFSVETEALVLARLSDEALRRRFTIATHRLVPGRLATPLFEPLCEGALTLHRSTGSVRSAASQ